MQACLAYVNFKRIFNSDIRKIPVLLTEAILKEWIWILHQGIKSIFHIGHNLSFAKFH